MLAKNCKGEQCWSTATRRPHGDTLHVPSRGENKVQKIPRDPPWEEPLSHRLCAGPGYVEASSNF